MIIKFKNRYQEGRGLEYLMAARINFAYRGDDKYVINAKQRAMLAIQGVKFSVI